MNNDYGHIEFSKYSIDRRLQKLMFCTCFKKINAIILITPQNKNCKGIIRNLTHIPI